MSCMARQLSLLESRRSWKLSETTREVGRRGVAEARASLEAAVAAARAAEAAKAAREHPRHGRSAA
jgi:hypothetical protein